MTPPTIPLHSTVRSFDFSRTLESGQTTGRDIHGEHACYAEGVLCAIIPMGEQFVPDDEPDNPILPSSCDRYAIRVTRRVFGGAVLPKNQSETWVAPPVNGTPSWTGRVTNSVEVIR